MFWNVSHVPICTGMTTIAMPCLPSCLIFEILTERWTAREDPEASWCKNLNWCQVLNEKFSGHESDKDVKSWVLMYLEEASPQYIYGEME